MEDRYLGEHTRKLGFGLMRLPEKDGKIDIEETKAMVDLFMQAGFTYFDTAWAYRGSEEAMKEALIDRYPRDSFTVASKLAAWIKCETREDAIKQFDESLERSGAGYFDYYLLHNLGAKRTGLFDDFGLWDFAFQKKAEGRIRHVGFSFHAGAEELDDVLTRHPEAEFVQLQINYADWEDGNVQSRLCYEVARKHNKPVVIMEPVKGGLLASPPERVMKVFKEADGNASPASWAIRFAASLDGVITVLSGMSSIEQVKDNISYMKDFMPLDENEKKVMENARKALSEIELIPCTSCGYCMKVCPMDIGIPATFSAMNMLTMYGNLKRAQGQERFHVAMQKKSRAHECIKCGACEEACPQHIEIRDRLEEAAEALHTAE